ncbi:citryl-CoA synthetase large subunit [Lentibacillus halodurans]|uniref:Citryl-CoA synthetase large subunit n=1 Tax=Lentibacillus halodurans TaxID=237679 RepID=A0A1I0XNM6_9BACI|nr:ATP-grasp domain-containing protein [Lentibacillus halodurans]SFB02572.1 citryl-CoA synthetase large subunit [Lentibacillus halodurans]
MGKILEHFSKKLIRKNGVNTPDNWVVERGYEARNIIFNKNIVLKALVPVGKRGKAGAVKFPETAEEAEQQTEELLKMTVHNFPVNQVLVEEKLNIKEEWYVSISIDSQEQKPVIMVTTYGGMDIEDLAKDHPEKIATLHVDPFDGIHPFQIKELWSSLGVTGKVLVRVTEVLSKLYDIFWKYDCFILEVNPLALTKDGNIVVADSVMGVDDTALYRQSELAGMVEVGSERSWRPLTELEKQMIEVNDADYRGTARYTEIEGGDIGFMCGGGGGSLVSFDALTRHGGKPANYTETGGNPPVEKVYGLTKGILSKEEVKGLYVAHNISNNTQIDVMAAGIIKALNELKIDPVTFPVVVREAGVNDEKGRKIFEDANVTYYGEEITIEQAALKMVKRMEEVYGWQS